MSFDIKLSRRRLFAAVPGSALAAAAFSPLRLFAQDGPIKIGITLPLSGAQELVGKHLLTSAEAAVTRSVDLVGVPRIVVNCAGVTAGGGLLTHAGAEQLEKFDLLFRINVYGTFSVMRHVIHHMQALGPMEFGERGVIVNTASIAGYEGQAGQTVYAASKAAIIGMTLPAARDLADLGIRVCAIAPGVFDTPILGNSKALVERYEKEIPFPRRRGEPSSFAGLVDHICTNPFLNGEVIRLDGALRAPPFVMPRAS